MKKAPKKFNKNTSSLAAKLLLSQKEKKQKKTPNNSRYITEERLSLPQLDNVILACFFCGILLMANFLSLRQVIVDQQALSNTKEERQLAGEELVYWSKITSSYPGYRDAYYNLAVRAYSVGNSIDAENAISKALQIDPNFKQGRDLQKQIGLN